MQNNFIDEDEEEFTFIIKNESDIIKYYNNCGSDEEMNALYIAIDEYNIESKIEKYKEQIYIMYKECFEEFMEIENPNDIFNTGLHNNMMAKFIEHVYFNSDKGHDLEFVLKIQEEYDMKLELERINEEKI